MVKNLEGTAGKSEVKNGYVFYTGSESIDSSTSAIDSEPSATIASSFSLPIVSAI